MASALVQEGEQDQRHYYKKLQLCTEILFPYLAFLSVTLRCPACGVTPGSEKVQGGLHLALGINFVCARLLEKKSCRNVSTVAAFFQKESNITTLYSNLFVTSPHCPGPNKGADLQCTTAVDNY